MKLSNQTQEWFKQAEYDLETAAAMFRSRRYIYTIFMCHLCLEKALKGLIAAEGRVPKKSHDLIFLLDEAGIPIPKQHIEFLEMLNDVSVPTRYPDDLGHLITQYPRRRAKDIVDRCKEVFEWIINCLQK
jgi:HEPN domain-containing protein